MPTATSTEGEPSHDLTLFDGTTTYGFILCDAQGIPNPFAIDRSPTNRTSIKMSQGSSKYDDLQGPHLSLVQQDWSGGRGLEDFEDDQSKFFDSYRLNTWMSGRAILGPQETYGTGYRDQDNTMPGSVTFVSLTGATRYLANKFTASAYDADKCYIWLRKVGTPNGNLTLELCSDDNGNPATGAGVKQTVNLAPGSVTDVASLFKVFDWTGAETLSAAAFHIKVYAASGDDDATDHWEVGTNAATGTTQKSTAGTNWASATGVDLYFRIVDADDTWVAHFFEYKKQMYFVTAPDDATAPEVFINGDRGTADSNEGALTTLVDAGGGWTTDEWAESVVVIVGGVGYTDPQNWRVIASNTATALTVSPAWTTQHDTTTEYVIVASNKFTAMTGHGLGVPVTDVCVSKDVVYFAQGDGTVMRRLNEKTVGTDWTPAWAADGSNYAKFLKVVEDPVSGPQVWKANDSLSSEPSVAKAPAQAWDTSLTFETAIVVGNRNERMTGLESYGDPEVLWVLKEGSLWDVANDIPNKKPLREMKAVASFKNGRAHLVQGVNLYFSLLHSLERYFRGNLDDVGPWMGAGLPADRQGVIYHMQGYPAFFLCALDGGASNYSSVLLSTGHGDWHEFYRAPETGQRIRRLHMQVIPGSTIDRLWVSQGTDVLWLPMPSDTLDPYRDSNYRFTHEGHLISAWHYANMQDVTKFWNSLKVFAEALVAAKQTIEADYQTDGDIETDTWTAINGTFDTVPVEEVGFTSTNNLTGRRLRYRLRFLTTENTKTPKMKAALIEALGRVAPKWQYSFTFRAKDENLDREGDDDSYASVETLIAKVDTWSASAVPLTMRCLYSPFDNKTVFAEAAPMRPYLVTPDEQSESHVSQMTVYEK